MTLQGRLGRPHPIWLLYLELTVEQTGAHREGVVAVRRSYPPALSFGLEPARTHEASDSLTGDLQTFSPHGVEAWCTVGLLVALLNVLPPEQRILLRAVADRPPLPAVIATHRHLLNPAHHIGPVVLPVASDEPTAQRAFKGLMEVDFPYREPLRRQGAARVHDLAPKGRSGAIYGVLRPHVLPDSTLTRRPSLPPFLWRFS